MTIEQAVRDLLTNIDDFENQSRDSLDAIGQRAEKLFGSAIEVSASWSGSWFGHHSELYYRDFQKPPLDERFSVEWGTLYDLPEAWAARSEAEVKTKIEQLAGAGFEMTRSDIDRVLHSAKKLRSDLQARLAPIRNYGLNSQRLGGVLETSRSRVRK